MSHRLSVLILGHGLSVDGPGGGVDRFCFELARALARRGAEPVLCGLWRIGTPQEPVLLERLHQAGIEAFLAADWDGAHPYRSFFGAWRSALHHLHGQRFDVIHSHFEFADGIALLLALPLRAHAVLRTVHNEREWRRRPGRRLLLTNLLYPLAFHLEIGISRQVADNLDRRPLARRLGRRAPCLPNVIDLERFARPPDLAARQRLRAELGLSAEAPLVISVGRLAQQKGYSVLIEAAAVVLSHVPEAHFLIVGEGELKQTLQDQAAALGLAEAIHFLGRRSDVDRLLGAADLFASSSLWEGLPTVLLEAMAAGLPIVATDVSGTRELIEDGVTGLRVAPGDAPALAAAIVRLLREPALGATLTEQAALRVQAFSVDRVADEHLRIYQALLTQKDYPFHLSQEP